MSPRDPDSNDSRIVDGWDQDDQAGVDGFDRYCARCRRHFPPSEDSAHQGH